MGYPRQLIKSYLHSLLPILESRTVNIRSHRHARRSYDIGLYRDIRVFWQRFSFREPSGHINLDSWGRTEAHPHRSGMKSSNINIALNY